ncbi:MAG TPA: glycerate kinase [Jatrophihabitans sp.]|nr:glycerate kinase [Jatrophihabitans sp.]
MTRVVLAPDKFKGTLTAAQVAEHLAAGMPDVETVTVPVADGGDGLLDAFEAAGFERVPVTAAGPTGERGSTHYVRRGTEAVVELAATCGLARLGDDRAPLTATSRGVGEVIAAALDAGCTHLVVGIGGSASTDGGAGLVQALGARVLTSEGTDVEPGGGALDAVATLDLSGLHPGLQDATIEVACDVDNPLTGRRGAAAVYGPQKGASPEDVEKLDAALTHWADAVADATGGDHRDDPGAGAAGGVGFAAVAILGATLRPGVELVLDMVDFGTAVAGVDLVVTGEGSLDEQTLNGKTPAGVAAAARKAGVPVVAVAGRCELDADALHDAGFRDVYVLADEAGSPDEAMQQPGPLLRKIGERIAESLSPAATESRPLAGGGRSGGRDACGANQRRPS